MPPPAPLPPSRTSFEALSRIKKRGGKKTSKRQPIRRTFRKKDKQPKKKNVSRKKLRK
jgi:hypothetical protein